MTKPKHPWQTRAVQLDLARQRETLPVIKRIRFAKSWGYNTLVLYLEAALTTKNSHTGLKIRLTRQTTCERLWRRRQTPGWRSSHAFPR